MKAPCPCFSKRSYAECCQTLHEGQPAPNAERLMRSRYSANVLKLADYLKQSWHASKRPEALTSADFTGLKWLGLEIMNADKLDATHASVEYKAKFRTGKEKTQTLHETSQFVLENEHWFYVDGEIHSD